MNRGWDGAWGGDWGQSVIGSCDLGEERGEETEEVGRWVGVEIEFRLGRSGRGRRIRDGRGGGVGMGG